MSKPLPPNVLELYDPNNIMEIVLSNGSIVDIVKGTYHEEIVEAPMEGRPTMTKHIEMFMADVPDPWNDNKVRQIIGRTEHIIAFVLDKSTE